MDAPLFKRSLGGHSNKAGRESTRVSGFQTLLGLGVVYSQHSEIQEFMLVASAEPVARLRPFPQKHEDLQLFPGRLKLPGRARPMNRRRAKRPAHLCA
jgi:hypothetical protein